MDQIAKINKMEQCILEKKCTDSICALEGNNATAELKKTLGNVIIANGQQAGRKFYEDHIYVKDDSMVIEENIVTDSGTIHVVDNNILLPWPKMDEE